MAVKRIAGLVLPPTAIAQPGSAKASGSKVTAATTHRERIALSPTPALRP